MKNKRPIIILTVVIGLLLIPFTAMQFTDQVDWSVFDFIIMGILLTGTGFLVELVMTKIKSLKYKIIIWVIIFFVFIFIWAELAVGMFGSTFVGN